MITINKNDTLFEQYDIKKVNESKEDFSHFGWEGISPTAFFTYADGYRIAAEAIFEKFQNSKGDFAVMDSIVYPLCFNYRHMMELLIKYLHLKYVLYETEDERIKSGLFSNHDLNALWNITKKTIEQLQSRVSSNVDIEAITHYINEMNVFDSKSFNMRYPVFLRKPNKTLTPSTTETRLIVPPFHEKMQAFFKAIEVLDSDIDNQVRFDVDNEKIIRFTHEFEATKNKVEIIIEAAKKLKSLSDRSESNEIRILSFDSTLNPPKELDKARKSLRDTLYQLSDNQLVLVHTLFYNGRDGYKLPNDATEKKKDYIKSAIHLMEKSNTLFDQTTIDRIDLIYPFISKQPRLIIEYLQKSLDILSPLQNRTGNSKHSNELN